MLEVLQHALHVVVEYAALILELCGICVLVTSGIKAFIGWLQKREVSLKLAEGIALALQFKMGGEVLHTVIVREWADIARIGAIIVLRVILTLLIHWEIKNETAENILEQEEIELEHARAEAEELEHARAGAEEQEQAHIAESDTARS